MSIKSKPATKEYRENFSNIDWSNSKASEADSAHQDIEDAADIAVNAAFNLASITLMADETVVN